MDVEEAILIAEEAMQKAMNQSNESIDYSTKAASKKQKTTAAAPSVRTTSICDSPNLRDIYAAMDAEEREEQMVNERSAIFENINGSRDGKQNKTTKRFT